MEIKEVTIDEVSLVNVILYKVRVNNVKIEALYDTTASISVMSHRFYNLLRNKPKLIKCNRSASEAGREHSSQLGNALSRCTLVIWCSGIG